MKKIISLILCLFLLFVLFVPAMAEDDPEPTKLKYVALGDSITAMGDMNYDSNNRYTDLLASDSDWNMQSFSHNGWRSDELRVMLEDDYDGDAFTKTFLKIYGGSSLKELQNSRKALRTAIGEADVISIFIGSNDLMGNLLFDMVGHVLDVQDFSSISAVIKKAAKNLLSVDDYTQTLFTAEKTFRTNWNHIIYDIRSLNPDAKIVAVGLYNPFSAANPVVKLPGRVLSVINSYLDSIIEYIQGDSPYSREYLFADISDMDLLESPDGIHPGLIGHEYIAAQIMATLNDSCPHENVETLRAWNPILLLPGYTGDVVCANCHELLQHGSLVTFTGRLIPLSKTIDIDIIISVKTVLLRAIQSLIDTAIQW